MTCLIGLLSVGDWLRRAAVVAIDVSKPATPRRAASTPLWQPRVGTVPRALPRRLAIYPLPPGTNRRKPAGRLRGRHLTGTSGAGIPPPLPPTQRGRQAARHTQGGW